MFGVFVLVYEVDEKKDDRSWPAQPVLGIQRVSIFGAINGTHYEGGNGSVKMHSSSAFTNIDLATDNSNNNDPLSD